MSEILYIIYMSGSNNGEEGGQAVSKEQSLREELEAIGVNGKNAEIACEVLKRAGFESLDDLSLVPPEHFIDRECFIELPLAVRYRLRTHFHRDASNASSQSDRLEVRSTVSSSSSSTAGSTSIGAARERVTFAQVSRTLAATIFLFIFLSLPSVSLLHSFFLYVFISTHPFVKYDVC